VDLAVKAPEVPPDGVVRAEDGRIYQAPGDPRSGWQVMQPIGYYGDPAGTAPDGELTLLVPQEGGRPGEKPG
jgi:hypothetical protein